MSKSSANLKQFSDLEGQYEILKQLGEGAYGVVAAAKDKASGDKVAIKRIKDAVEDKEQVFIVCPVFLEPPPTRFEPKSTGAPDPFRSASSTCSVHVHTSVHPVRPCFYRSQTAEEEFGIPPHPLQHMVGWLGLSNTGMGG